MEILPSLRHRAFDSRLIFEATYSFLTGPLFPSSRPLGPRSQCLFLEAGFSLFPRRDLRTLFLPFFSCGLPLCRPPPLSPSSYIKVTNNYLILSFSPRGAAWRIPLFHALFFSFPGNTVSPQKKRFPPPFLQLPSQLYQISVFPSDISE